MKNTLFFISLFFISLFYSQAQSYELDNDSFEIVNGTVPIFHTAFTNQQIGDSWYAHTGSPDVISSNDPLHNNVIATDGNRMAHTYHRIVRGGGSTWHRSGESFYMYYPMQAGQNYNLEFDLKLSSKYNRFYVIATNGLNPNTNGTQADHSMDEDNNISNVYNGDIVVNYFNTHTNWKEIAVTNFVPSQNYTQLLFIPYIDIVPNSNTTSAQIHCYIDAVKFTGTLGPSRVAYSLNGQSCATNVGIHICNEEEVIMDPRDTVDTTILLNYFVEINRVDNGVENTLFQNWYSGLPINNINLSDELFNATGNTFSAPSGGEQEYVVKLAINSGTGNAWIEKRMRVIVDGGPGFTFNNTIDLIYFNGGFQATSRVVGLPAGNYSYEWHEGNTTNTPTISNNDQITIYKNAPGSYPYTVVVTDLNTGCSNVMTTFVNYRRSSVSLEQESYNDEFKMYPNPAINDINIRTNRSYDVAKVYTTNGNPVINSKDRKIDVSFLEKGLYIIKFFDGATVIATEKFIKK